MLLVKRNKIRTTRNYVAYPQYWRSRCSQLLQPSSV